MSNNNTVEPTEKQNLVKRTVNYVKSHKKSATAVVAFVGLVGVCAYADAKHPLPGSDSTESPEDTVA